MNILVFLAVLTVGAIAQSDDASVVPPFTCEGNAFTCKLQELGHHIKFHAGQLGDKLKQVGSSVLDAATEQGKNLLASGAQAALGTILEQLQKVNIVGKRSLALEDILYYIQKGASFIQSIKEKLSSAYNNAVDEITQVIQNTAGLKDVAENVEQKINAVVETFGQEGKNGFAALVNAVKDTLKGIFGNGIDQLRQMLEVNVVRRAIISPADLWNKAKDHFSNIVGGLSDAFKPHLDALTEGVKGLADKAKNHASNLVESAKTGFSELKDKLGAHLETLKGHVGNLGSHAQNALAALKDTVADIVSQTASNLKDTVGDIVNTGLNAAGTVKDHFSGY